MRGDGVDKRIRFRDQRGKYWPSPSELEPFFLTQRGREQWFYGGNDSWGLDISGLYGTDNLPTYAQIGGAGLGSQVESHFEMDANLDYGVLVSFDRYGGGYNDHYCSINDSTRLHEWVRTLHQDLRPVGLYIPFNDAWAALKEFMETDGEMPKCIKWVNGSDLPPYAFPDRSDISFNSLVAIND